MIVWAAMAWGMDVAVVEDPRRDRWTVTWTTEVPVRGLLFTRNRTPVQADFSFRGFDPGDQDGHQVVFARRGRRTDTFTATFDTNTDWRDMDYELNVQFGDGARLLYTDHLFVVPLVCPDGGDTCDDASLTTAEATSHRFTFTTSPDRFVLTPDGRTGGTGAWTQDAGGVYIYFGMGAPLPDDRVHFVLDPTLPQWIVDRSREWIGPLLDHYAAQTARALSFQPMILLSYDGAPTSQTYSGGGLPGQMQLELSGQGWSTEHEGSREVFARFLAHETFHMWNGEELSTDIDASEEWLSEGSAELFSLWAIAALGLVDDAGVASRVRDTASLCTTQLRGGPLVVAHRSGNARAFYSCGATGLFLLDARLRAAAGEASLATVFRDLFAEGDRYSTYGLLEAAHRQADDPLVVADLEVLLRRGLGADPIGYLAEALTAAEVPTVAVDAWTVDGVGDRVLHTGLVKTIGDCDCGGALSVWDRGERLEFGALDRCDVLRDGLMVTSVAEGPILPKRDALARAWAEITSTGSLTLEGSEGQRVALACEQARPPRALVVAD